MGKLPSLSLGDFRDTKLLVKVFIHLGGNPVSNTIHRSSHVSRIRRGKNISKVIHERLLNILVTSSLVSLLIQNEVNFVFSFPLGSFKMKESSVQISMLQPVYFSTLRPLSLFLFQKFVQTDLHLVNISDIIFSGDIRFFIMNFLLGLFDLSRNVAIGVLTPSINLIKNLLEFSFSVRVILGPFFFDNIIALRILEPNMFKVFDGVRMVGIIPEIKISTKNMQYGDVVRGVN
jgi:hypothetical protein